MIMKKKKLTSLFVILTVTILAFNAVRAQNMRETKTSLASPKPITNSATWGNTSKDKVFNNCITALHLQNYVLAPSFNSKESGLILTGPVDFFPPFWKSKLSGGEYQLNILVYETETNSVSIHIQINGANIFDYKLAKNAEDGYIKNIVEKGTKNHYGGFDTFELWNGLTMKISEDIEQFLMQLEKIQGKAISKTTVILRWE